MGKRVTIYDIAKEAGVSAATVSYVINETEGQSISEETKNKIWHVINMLNYKPNVFAKNLRSSSGAKLVAVCTDFTGIVEKAEFIDFLEELASALEEDFDIIFCTRPFARITNADAIVAYNVNRDTFYEIGNRNYIPLISVNCLVEDKLFFQITPDYKKLRRAADSRFNGGYTFVSLPPADDALKSRIINSFENVVFVGNDESLGCIDAENIFTVNGAIAEYFKDRNVLYEPLYAPLCRQTADCVRKALSHEHFDVHSYEI